VDRREPRDLGSLDPGAELIGAEGVARSDAASAPPRGASEAGPHETMSRSPSPVD
jgi:hypothetical protein